MIEIEHKFLLKNDDWKASASDGIRYQQGYIATHSETTVRVRIAGDKGYLTLKGPSSGEENISRTELEYEIPLYDARTMINELVDSPIIDKHRHLVIHAGKTWEIDVFSGDNAGLVIAEIELSSEHEEFEIPGWVGQCVSTDSRYSNYSLARVPFKDW